MNRRSALRALTAIGAGAATGAIAHGYLYERHHVEVTREKLEFRGLPPAFAGFRIGLISDIHRSESVPHALIDRAVRLLLAEHPDLIVLGGDYVTWGDRRYVAPAAEVLAPLTAPYGVLAVLGNHDDDRDMPAALAARGFSVLRDQRTAVTIKGDTLEFAGIRFWTRKAADIAYVLRGARESVVLLAHTPSRLYEAAALQIPLILSGHTHGGQIVLPGIGPIAGRKFPLLAGKGRQNGTSAFVTRGVGTVYVPVRLNCAPEVAVLTLMPG